MKKIISTLLVMAFALSTLAFGVIGAGAVDSEEWIKSSRDYGTVADDYAPATGATEVKDVAGFKAMTADGNYYLSADITLDATYTTTFKGTLDGCGHTINVLNPVFTKTENATIKNLKIRGNVKVTGGYVGALINSFEGTLTLENVANYASVENTGTGAGSKDVTGGIVGRVVNVAAKATIKDCYNKGDITGPEAVGGILGESQRPNDMVSFEGCLNEGKITAGTFDASGNAAGGIMGYSGTGRVLISRCVNKGEISALYNAGGIAGDARKSATIENCVNQGNVTGTKQVGGICGRGSDGDVNGEVHTVKNCVNYGTVTGGQYVAGIEGYIYSATAESTGTFGVVENCVNFGDVVGNEAGVYVSHALGYSNVCKNSVISNIVGVGKLSVKKGVTGYTVVFGVNAKSPAIKGLKLENCFFIGADAKPTYYTHDAKNNGNIILFTEVDNKDLAGSTTVKKVTTAAEFSDELADAINTAFGSTLVVNNDGALALADRVVTPGIKLPPEPVTPGTGDATVAYIVLACVCATVVLGLVFIPKKKTF